MSNPRELRRADELPHVTLAVFGNVDGEAHRRDRDSPAPHFPNECEVFRGELVYVFLIAIQRLADTLR